jgi:hypothetical protein
MPVFTPVTPIVVTPATLSSLGSFHAGATPRSCTVTLYWWKDTLGTVASTVRASDTSAAITDSTSVWLATGKTVTAPSDAVTVSIGVSIAGCAAGEVHYLDMAGIFPGIVTQWAAGGYVGATTATITYSDDGGVTWATVRGANGVVIPSTTQQVTVNDYEEIPGTLREYQATVQTGTPALISVASGVVTATVTTKDWWLVEPTTPSSATHVTVTAIQVTQMELSAVHVPIGDGSDVNYVSVVSSGFTGLDGTATIQAFSAATYAKLVALATSGKTLFFSSPFGDHNYIRLGPMPGGMTSGAGNKALDATMQASTPANPKRTMNLSWVAQPRPAV